MCTFSPTFDPIIDLPPLIIPEETLYPLEERGDLEDLPMTFSLETCIPGPLMVLGVIEVFE